MLDDAINLLPQSKVAKLVKGRLNTSLLRPDATAKGRLLAAVREFRESSLRRDYYEGFNVNSKNCMQKSKGTQTWLAECERLFDRCVNEAGRRTPGEVRRALDILFDLLRLIDHDPDRVIFFADEGGSYEVGVDWAEVLPAWFKCLSATSSPDEYATHAVAAIDEFVEYHRKKYLPIARKLATPEQRRALPKK
ncbi:MAG: hypothetical protein ABIF82_04680 [Planctomycetota bacterium]